MDPWVAIQDAAWSIVPAAMVAFVIGLALRRLLSLDACERWEAALAIALAYAAGYLFLPSLTEIKPTRNWHWTLYLVPAAGIVGPLCTWPRIPVIVRWLLCIALALVSAFALTPTWKNLWPPRPVCIPLLAGYLLMLAALVQPLAARVAQATLLTAMAGTLFAVSAVIGATVSLVNGQVALIAFGAAAGYVATFWRSATPPRPLGVALVYAMLAGGWAFFGTVQPNPAKWGLLLAPFAPAMLWLSLVKPVAQLQGKALVAAQAALVFAAVAASAAIVQVL